MKKINIERQEPYNPLEKRNIGENVIKALLDKPLHKLPPAPFIGAGVYAIYYTGNCPLYSGLPAGYPIYVGKAVPLGARKGNVGLGQDQGQVLYNRLREHAESINAVHNLNLNDFQCRYLAVDDIWIPLAETLLIEKFHPVWNIIIDGFGNHDPGKGRYNQQKSAWDVVHSGRGWAERLRPHKFTEQQIIEKIQAFVKSIDEQANGKSQISG